MNYETGNYAYVLKSKVGDLSQISLIASDLDKNFTYPERRTTRTCFL
ncbi:hypothetical protein CCAN2_1910010 [Capnocytophaga canimorsus]|nr:hypothetical protein CCAN2_1910010 [Capnocytophaga canimorsus]